MARHPKSSATKTDPKRVKRIALFNHKGGVSKTTTTFNLGWMLASKGHRVVLADADPQCSLSGLVLGYKGQDEFEAFYEKQPERNIRAGLAPAFESRPKEIEGVECVPVVGNKNLFLLPGHIRLSEYEVRLVWGWHKSFRGRSRRSRISPDRSPTCSRRRRSGMTRSISWST